MSQSSSIAAFSALFSVDFIIKSIKRTKLNPFCRLRSKFVDRQVLDSKLSYCLRSINSQSTVSRRIHKRDKFFFLMNGSLIAWNFILCTQISAKTKISWKAYVNSFFNRSKLQCRAPWLDFLHFWAQVSARNTNFFLTITSCI